MLVRTVAALLGLLPLLCCTQRTASLPSAATLIHDETTRLKVLAAVFPNARISEIPGKRIDSSFSFEHVAFPDALRDETVYDVQAPPAGNEEACAASSIPDPETVGQHRELRFRLFSLANRPLYVAAMQYRFSDTAPAFGCQSMARVALVSQGKQADDSIPDMTHHDSLQTIEFANLTGQGTDNLIIESDWGGGGAQFGELFIFDLASNKLHQLLAIRARGVDNAGDEWVSVLDAQQTAAKKGKEFCFTETKYATKGKPLKPPDLSHPCYPPGTANQ